MRARKVGLFIVVILTLVGCSVPATVPPATPNTPTITAVPSETLPSTPTIQPSPTITPEAPLQTSGPHFLYFREAAGEYQLVVMDADGKGRKVISLPSEFVESLANKQYGLDLKYVSPDGKWLAYYTGFAGDWMMGMQEGTFDLQLNLWDLTTGERKIVTPLLSQDYPNNFVEAAKKLNDPYITTDSLFNAFVNGIKTANAWSPDGHYLAFAGQMDGLSSDLYVYEVETGAIRRLSSGDQEIQWISWSPDGKWIVHSSVYSVGAGMTFDIYAAAIDGSSVRYLSTNSVYGGIEKWLNAHTYFENDSQNGPGRFGLRLVDIHTGKVTSLWKGSFFSYASDLRGQWVVVAALLPDTDPFEAEPDKDFVPGLYLINLKTMEKTHIDHPTEEVVLQYQITPVDSDSHLFFLEDNFLSYAFFLSESGEVTPLDFEDTGVFFSRDLQYGAAVSSQEIKVFFADNSLLKSIPFKSNIKNVRFEVNWRPDDSGFFLCIEKEIYAVDVSSGSVELVETNVNDTYGQKFMWINEK